MKKLLSIIALLVIIVSCTEEETTTDKKYRMTESTKSDENSLYKNSFSYENNKIKQIIRTYNHNNQGWEVGRKTEYSYTNNSITRMDYSENNGEFFLSEKQEMTFENTLLVNSVTYFYYNGEINYTVSKNYQYNADGIYHIDIFRDGVLKNKTDFIYSDNQINMVNYYNPEGDWIEDFKGFFKYSGNMISSYESHFKINIDDDWQYFGYNKSVYNNDKLSELIYHDWDYEIEEWYKVGTIFLKYNSNNKLEKIESINDGRFHSFKYEEGETNLENIIRNPFSDLLKGWPLQMKYIFAEYD